MYITVLLVRVLTITNNTTTNISSNCKSINSALILKLGMNKSSSTSLLLPVYIINENEL